MKKETRYWISFTAISVLAISLLVLYAVGGAFTASVSPVSANQSASQLYNFTIANEDAAENITALNITLPAGTGYDSSSGSSVGDANFQANDGVLSWYNESGLILASSTEYFWFNATASVAGDYNFTVYTNDTAGVENTTNVSVTINDVAPRVSTLTVSDSLITISDIGSMFKVTLDFSESMNTSVDPVITFNPVLSSLLIANSSAWTDSNTFEKNWSVNNSASQYQQVSVNVTGAKDLTDTTMDEQIMPNQFAVDTQAPALTVLSPANTTYDTHTIFFNATADEQISNWTVNWNGTNTTLSDINTSKYVENAGFQLLMWANDSSGNWGLNDSVYFTVYVPGDYILNATVEKTVLNSTVNYGDVAEFKINVTNTGEVNITQIVAEESFDFGLLNFTNQSSPVANVYNNSEGSIYWNDASAGVPLAPNQSFIIYVNFTILGIGLAQNNVSVDAYRNLTNFTTAASTSSITIEDNIFPQITINLPSDSVYYDNATQLVNITCTDDYNLDARWFFNGSDNVTYFAPVDVTFAEGPNTLYAWCNDTSNNVNSTNVTFTIDTIYPTIQFVYPTTEHGSVKRLGDINLTFSDTNLNYAISYIYNSSGNYIGDSGEQVFSPYTSLNISLPSLTYLINATVYDLAGHSSSTETRNITIDTTLPSITFNSPTNWQWFNTSTVLVNITFYDLHLNSTWFFNTTANQTYEQPVNITLADGTFNITAYANDNATNFKESTITFYVDTQAPVVTSISPEDGYVTNTTAVNFTFNITDNLLSNLECTLYVSGLTENYTFTSNGSTVTFQEDLSENINQPWYVGCTDTAGNAGFSETRNITIDATAPVWSGNKTSPASPTTYNASQQYQFNVTWADATTGVNTVQIEHNFTNGTLANYTVSTNSSNEYYYNYTGLAAGSYVWREYANDTLGNLNKTDQWAYSVARITSACSLIFNADSPQTYGTAINASCSCNNPEASALLYRNGTDVTGTDNNALITLAGGDHGYVCNVTGTQNYTSASNSSNYTINKATPSLGIYFDGMGGSIERNVDTNILINGTASTAQGIVNVTDNGVQIATGSGSASTTVNYSAEGVHTIMVSYPASQNYSYNEVNYNITVVDNVAPLVNITDPINNTWSTTQDPTITYYVNDTHSGLANCSLFVDSAFKIANSSVVKGTNAFVQNIGGEGTHTIRVTCYDNSSLKNSNSSTITLKVDVAAPSTTIFGVSNTSYSSNRTITFNASDATSLVNRTEYNITGACATAWTNLTNYTLAISCGTEGVSTINYRSIDNAGNVETMKSVTFTIDKSGPMVVITSPSAGANVSGTVTFSANATDSGQNASYVVFKFGGATNVTVSPAPFTTSVDTTLLQDGTKTWAVDAYDSLGNMNSTNVTVTIDNTAPVSNITYPANNFLTKSAVSINGTSSDSIAGVDYVEVQSSEEGIWYNASVNTTTGLWNYTMSFSISGTYQIKSRAVDKLGNAETPTIGINIVFDSTAPTISGIEINPNPAANDTSISISATATDSNGIAVVNATLNGTTVQLSTSRSNIYTGTMNSPLEEGTYNLTILAIDNATNSATDSAYQLIVNATAPIITITPVNGTIFANGTAITINVTNADTIQYNTTASPALTTLNGTNSTQFAASGSEETYIVYVWTNSSSGAIAEKTNTYTIDNTAPIVAINAVTTPTRTATQNISGNVTDTNKDYVLVNGALATLSGSNYWRVVSLSEGNNTINVTAYDKTGLSSTSTTTIVLDTIAPTTNHSLSGTLGENGWYTSDVVVTLSATDDSGSGIASTLINTGSGLTAYSAPVTLNSTVNVSYRSIDNATNNETLKSAGQIKIDKTSPAVSSINISTTLPAANEQLTIRATINDTNQLGTAQTVNIDGTDYTMALESGSVFKYDFTPSEAKTYAVTVTGKDIAGNTATGTTSFVAGIKQQTSASYSFVNTSVNPVDYSTQASASADVAVNTSVNGNLTVVMYNSTPDMATSLLTNGMRYVDINISSSVSDVLEWILIKIHYTDAEVTAAGLDESTLTMSWYNESSGTWIAMSAGTPSWCNGVGLDMTNNYVWANVSHLSLFGISGLPPTVTTTTLAGVTTGGGGGAAVTVTTIGEIVRKILLYKAISVNYIRPDGTNEMHSIKLIEVTDTTATLQIMSTMKTYKMNEGETINVDVDGDGTSDIKVRLVNAVSNMVSKYAEIGIKMVDKTLVVPGESVIPVTPPEEQKMPTTTTMPGVTTTTMPKPITAKEPSLLEKVLLSPAFWASLIIVLVLIAALVIYKIYHRQ